MKKQTQESQRIDRDGKAARPKAREKREWETPRLEDVSEQVMAQPYIRFT